MAQLIDLTQLLLAAQSADHNARTQAEASLKQLQEGQYPTAMASLAAELANNDKPADTRRLAGLILKNALDAKEEARKASPRRPSSGGGGMEPALLLGLCSAGCR